MPLPPVFLAPSLVNETPGAGSKATPPSMPLTSVTVQVPSACRSRISERSAPSLTITMVIAPEIFSWSALVVVEPEVVP